jgi:hypothetical protein
MTAFLPVVEDQKLGGRISPAPMTVEAISVFLN